MLRSVSLAALAAVLLSACGGSDPAPVTSGGTPLPGGGRAGVSSDVYLESAVDGEQIAFTVHEPTSFVPGQKYPLILEGHGYGGSRVNAAERPATGDAGTLGRLLDAGYGVISIDQRGFGEAGGTVRLFDPAFEGKDLIQLLDWAEANLDWLAYRDANLLLGAIGGSYGGGYQHTIYALDPKHRLDAIVPEITWHDLRYALFSGNVFKNYWAALLAGAGTATGTQDAEIYEGLAQGLTLNSLDAEKQDLLYRVSLASHCENNNAAAPGPLTKIDAMYWQSARDTLFNLNDAVHNYKCVAALGGDVRLLVRPNGHDGGGGEVCGKLQKTQAIVDWYDEKLKGVAGKASYVPKFCFHLDTEGDDGIVTATLPEGGTAFQVPATSIIAQDANLQVTGITLMQVGAEGAILAGIPRIRLTVTDPAGAGLGDPIIFVGLAKRAAGTSTDTLLMANQVRPFRGYGEFVDELVGVSARLAPNDELRLLIHPSFAARYPGSGTDVATPVTVEATVELPLLPANLPAAPAN